MTAYSSARPGNPWFITIHTGEGILDKDDMVSFLDNNPDASAHAAADAEGVAYGGVPDERAAWTAGPTANNWGLHIELCAFAQMTRDQWLSEVDVAIFVPWIGKSGAWRTIRKPKQMLRHAAAWARAKADKFKITIRKVNATQLRADVDGICGHADTSAAWGETDHTDPGTGFPWDVFISMVQGQSDQGDDNEMLSTEAQKWLLDNFPRYTHGDRELAQSAAARTQAVAMCLGEAPNGPDEGETLQGPINQNLILWRLFNLMFLNEEGTQDRAADDGEYPFVVAFNKLVADVEAIKSRIGLTNHDSPISEV